MMKIWGIFMAGCVLAFGVLLGMFLNQSKAAGGETQSAETMAAAESATDAGTDNAMAGEELPADIQSLIADSQENYAAAMRVFEEETAAEGEMRREVRCPAPQRAMHLEARVQTPRLESTGQWIQIETTNIPIFWMPP